ncbi:glutamate dehydrogenase [Natronocella acetinitrilica]|uniref:Glutamate dehydrogenase n=1 Tax=Natronocella acetinitrilica TaxID=414046 RepID=A0AAE3KAB6_9GAMM|nr:NAD-glutamate dehydrogenase [Natronocella acetinitrilica]MCP1673324.1 glutamate dehydrogenase [Natronocella acetinitrilica]
MNGRAQDTQQAIERHSQELISNIRKRIRERWSGKQAPQLERYLDQYYHRVAADDLAQRQAGDLYGAAVSHWNLARKRRAGAPRIHVYNPDPEQHGWESTHTAVQIVTDDLPFLVDSVAMALNRAGLTIHLIIHPLLYVTRNSRGDLQTVEEDGKGNGHLTEAWMHFEVDRQPDEAQLEALHEELIKVLSDCRTVVNDWQPMRQMMADVVATLATVPRKHVDAAERDEAVAFLEWLIDNHFTFLGYRRYQLKREKRRHVLQPVEDSAQGILRHVSTARSSHSFNALPEAVRAMAEDPNPLVLTKSNRRATVHRNTYMDYVGIKEFDSRGKVIGEHRFLGLYTSAAYHRAPQSIPLLRRKVSQVLERAALPHPSHDSKALINILENYPRDELFQVSPDTLFRIAMGILQLQDRQRVRLFVRNDTYLRFVSCLVFAPRDRYDSDVRRAMQAILLDVFQARQCEFQVNLSEAVLARIHFIIHVDDHQIPDVDRNDLEQRLAACVHDWRDDLSDALLNYYGEARGNRLYSAYCDAFSAAYREDTQPRAAAHDVERLEHLGEQRDLEIVLYRPLEAEPSMMRLRLYHRGGPITLSDALPLLENMGVRVLDERPYAVHAGERETAFIHDFGLQHDGQQELDIDQVRKLFEDCFDAAWHERIENDGFNRLVLAARLDWREIVILRAYSKYLRQAGTSFSQAYMEETLVDNPRISRLLVRLFHNRFDPEREDAKRVKRLAEQIELALNDVPSLDQDRILRRLLAGMLGTLRTNYYQVDDAGDPKHYISLKLDPRSIPEIPQPLPAYEIFVYARRVEGVHLRGGKVARGGLRWSDRREDFRTEVLGLMKAQTVKNAVIVPVGAKGGFVCKMLPEEREAVQQEVKACYRTFIQGLLDITDNYPGGVIKPPPRVVRHDEDDPYLVVAADKGTATFSDLANSIAEEYDFWLHDAFASGGSNGYDHKKMGITARGGWEAVKRHFREMGHDTQREPFTVVGVGDMSGDVFGNGMLLSDQIKLLAAFDHRHIFIDPDPDPAASFKERQRLFALDRSTWESYDSKLISKGGGVFPRTAKSIPLTAQMQAVLGTDAKQLTPNELIQVILKAPVDLLWNGGIGTYVKASNETHLQVGDRANDAVRVDAAELRCKVIGEGGNLGLTQLGRIEYSLNGGRINTDAIDNAGGVDCSDHEVNIKILLNAVMDRGELTQRQRNRMLSQMTERVAELVLAGNYRQTEALSLMQSREVGLLNPRMRMIRQLERQGQLNRRLEGLPSEQQIVERSPSGHGLTRPESAVLLAYAKLTIYDTLLDGGLPDDPDLQDVLFDYFPAPLPEKFRDDIREHRLRREIIATQVTNEILNRTGATYFFRMHEASGSETEQVARAFLAVRRILGLDEVWAGIDALDNQVHATLLMELRRDILDVVEDAVLALLRDAPPALAINATAERLRASVGQMSDQLEQLLTETDLENIRLRVEHYVQGGVPEQLAAAVCRMGTLTSVLDVSPVAEEAGMPLDLAVGVHFQLADRLALRWLGQAIDQMPTADAWQERCRMGLRDDSARQHRMLTSVALRRANGKSTADHLVASWADENERLMIRLSETIDQLQAQGQPDVPMLTVAMQELKNLVTASGSRAA